jgi:hypothetical protein
MSLAGISAMLEGKGRFPPENISQTSQSVDAPSSSVVVVLHGYIVERMGDEGFKKRDGEDVPHGFGHEDGGFGVCTHCIFECLKRDIALYVRGRVLHRRHGTSKGIQGGLA